MADERNLFNKREISDESPESNGEHKPDNVKDVDSDFVDFSAAFNDDEEDDIDADENNEAIDEPRPSTSIFSKIPLFKKKKNYENPLVETESDDKTDEIEPEETSQPEEKKEDGSESQVEKVEDVCDTETEKTDSTEEQIEEQETVAPMSEEVETYAVEEEESVQEEKIEKDVEENQKTAEESVEGSQDEQGEVVDSNTVNNVLITRRPERKTFRRFAFLNKRRLETTGQIETITESVEEKQADDEIEMLPKFEETESKNTEESVLEQEIQIVEPDVPEEDFIEETTSETESAIEEVPPFESVVTETESPIDELPPFESVVAETESPIEELPPFEETGQEETGEDSEEEKKEEPEEVEENQVKKSSVEKLTMRDHLTFVLIIIALLLTIAFVCVKFIPIGNSDSQGLENVTEVGQSVSEIQVQRKSATGHYIQSDVSDLFYSYAVGDGFTFYQYDNKKITSIHPAGAVNAVVEVGGEVLSVKVDYVEIKDEVFGMGVFNGSYNGSVVVFKLVNLPKGYEQDGKALLLVTTNPEAVSQHCNVWSESFVIDLASGKTTRFLSTDNNPYSTGYSILTDEGYLLTNGKIPFFTSREYDAGTNKRDIFLKDNGKELLFAEDVAGSFVYVDGNTISYLKATENGFNVTKKVNGKEQVIFSLHDNTSYLYHNEYLLDKYSGNLYNVKIGEKKVLEGYGMTNPEMMVVSDDGRYLVVSGTVNSAIDYQVHIFDLKKNSCAKYMDDNFSQHKNLSFVDNKTIVYSVVEPSQGYEYVILDVSKAF